jgi:hypothetical protein
VNLNATYLLRRGYILAYVASNKENVAEVPVEDILAQENVDVTQLPDASRVFNVDQTDVGLQPGSVTVHVF